MDGINCGVHINHAVLPPEKVQVSSTCMYKALAPSLTNGHLARLFSNAGAKLL